jgi:hypothetical protein
MDELGAKESCGAGKQHRLSGEPPHRVTEIPGDRSGVAGEGRIHAAASEVGHGHTFHGAFPRAHMPLSSMNS